MNNTNKIAYAITYSKTGTLKYISHLDLIAVFDKALRRTRWPLYYTQGFNRKVKMSFPKAYPLGVEVTNEEMTVYLTEPREPEVMGEQLGATVPKGLVIHHVEKK